jgi:CzcA family heavy metal efflux pump
MMRWLIGSSLKLRLSVLAIAAAVMFFGIRQLRKMPVDVLPEFSPPYVEVQTEALGLSAEEVEQLITVPMEQDLLNGLPWLKDIRSKSVPGMSSILLVFERGTDILRARQMVTERMAQAFALPHVSRPPVMLQPVSATNRLMMIGLSSKELSLIQMSVLARWTIKPRLLGVPGVANVAIWGERNWQLQVQVDPKRLRANNASLLDVLETTGNSLWVSSLSFVEASTPGTGGFIETHQQRLGVRHISPIVTADSLAQVPIADKKKRDGTPLRLSDVANVVEGHQPLIGDAEINADPSLLMVIEKFPGKNTLEVTRGVEEALAELQPGLPGMEINTSVFRPASFIERARGNLATTLLIGGILAALALFALFANWRSGLIGLVAILMSLLAAVIVLDLLGTTMNAIILAGIAIAVGLVVDDAIVDIEHIMQRIREHRQKENTQSMASIIFEAVLEMRRPLVFASLIILLTVVPIFSLTGLSAGFFQPLALSYALAVLVSMLVALTGTPVLCLLLLTDASVAPREGVLIRWLRNGFDGLMAGSVKHSRVAVIALAGLVIISLAIFPFLKRSLIPQFKERDLLIHLDGAPGASQPEMSRIANRVSRELRSIPGVRDVDAHIGRAVFGDQIVNVNSAELWANLDPAADYDKTMAAVRQVVHGYPGLHSKVQTYLNEKSSQVVAKANEPISVRLYGEETPILRSQAEEVRKTLSGINGIVDSHVKLPVIEPVVDVQVNLAAAQRHGIKPGDVRRTAATLLSGIQVGSLFEEQKVFDVVVWSTPETRRSLSDIRELQIDTPGGGHVRLGDVAEVRVVPAPNVVNRQSVSRYMDISANVRGRDSGAVASEVKQRLKQMHLPLEYHAELLGNFASRQAARNRLIGLAIAALIGIFFLLQAVSGSWRLAFAVLLASPAALLGGLLAVVASGGILSLGAIIGLLALLGISARNGVMLIRHFHHLEQREGESFGPELVLRGIQERFAPIVMTALTTAIFFLPFALGGNIAGFEIVHPLAIVILGGLVISTLFILFGMPAVYLIFGVNRASELDLSASVVTKDKMREVVAQASSLEDVKIAMEKF